MKITIEVKSMQAGLNTVVKSLSSKPTMRILEGIYVETVPEGLLLRCSDLSLQIDCIIPAVVDEEGAAVLPGRLFSEIVRKFSGENMDMILSNKTMLIKSGRARTNLQCLDPKEFPDMAVNGDIYSAEIAQNICRDMIRQTAFAIAQEDSKPILTGILCELNEGIFNMVALDGFRLALRKSAINFDLQDKEFVVPGKSMLDIGRTLLDTEELVTLQFSRTHLLIDMGHTRIISRLLDGNFIKYKGLLPVEYNTRVRVNRAELLESIERANLLSREGGNNLVKFTIEEDQLSITANSPIGKMEEEMPIHLNGTPLEIAFNARYFSDVLKALDEDEIFLDMNNSVSPCVVKPIQGDAFYYLILPVRIFA